MLSEEEIKSFSMEMLGMHLKSMARIPFRNSGILFGTHRHPFHLGDHPVVLDNDMVRGRGSFGLASPGVASICRWLLRCAWQ